MNNSLADARQAGLFSIRWPKVSASIALRTVVKRPEWLVDIRAGIGTVDMNLKSPLCGEDVHLDVVNVPPVGSKKPKSSAVLVAVNDLKVVLAVFVWEAAGVSFIEVENPFLGAN